MQEENFSEALGNASKVWAPPRICELLLWLNMQMWLNIVFWWLFLCIYPDAYQYIAAKGQLDGKVAPQVPS